jgi:predicted O-methyltransferase YrrM
MVASTSFAQYNALDQHLRSHGFFMSPNGGEKHLDNEGYMTNEQQQQFTQQLKRYPITSIVEIGLNGGHSAFHFIQQCTQLQKFVSFDIATHAETKCAVQFFQTNYEKMFEFFAGPSQKTVPEYHIKNPTQKFDLIYIDGSHDYENCYLDIINCKQLAHENTIVWFDDYIFSGPERAVQELVNADFIVIDDTFTSNGKCGGRSWLQFRYKNN